MTDQPEATGNKQAETQFKPGQSGNPKGRPKGSRNKLGEAFISALHQDFEDHGEAAIEKVRTEQPAAYLRVIAQIVPKELNVNHSKLDELSDDELAAAVDGLRAYLAAQTPEATGTGTEAQTRH